LQSNINVSNRNKEKNDHPVNVKFELYFHKEYLLWGMDFHFNVELSRKINFLPSNHSNSNNMVLNLFSFELGIGRLKNIKPCLISTFAESNIVKDQIEQGIIPENEKRQRCRQTKHKLPLSDDNDCFEKKRRRLNNENEFERNHHAFSSLSNFPTKKQEDNMTNMPMIFGSSLENPLVKPIQMNTENDDALLSSSSKWMNLSPQTADEHSKLNIPFNNLPHLNYSFKKDCNKLSEEELKYSLQYQSKET